MKPRTFTLMLAVLFAAVFIATLAVGRHYLLTPYAERVSREAP